MSVSSNKSSRITMKQMKDSTVARTYDADGLRRRSACLCFRDRTEKEILLISSTHDVEKWIVPGGGIDPGEESRVAAEREALEEAGVVGIVDRLLGVFENREKSTRTWVYALYVHHLQDHWTESKSLDRRRRWFPLCDAKKALSVHKPLQVNYINVIEAAKVTS